MGPHSKGCRACVRRHVKCDETRPYCKRCRKAKIECPGFRDPFVFVDETEETLQRLEASQGRRTESGGPSSTSRSTPLDNGPGRGLSVPSEEVHVAYLMDRFVATGSRYIDHTSNSTWMRICLTKPEQYPVATSAIKCLATTFFGRQHHTDPIKIEAARSYGHNLRNLSQALQDPQTAWSFDVLAAAIALNYYEYLSFTTRKGWIRHAQGVGKLLEVHGPTRLRDYPSRSILETARAMIIGEALAARHKTFLENAEWWDLDLDSENMLAHLPFGPDYRPFNDLDQLYSRLPGIVELVQSLPDSESDLALFADRMHRTKEKVSKFKQDLERWYEDWTQFPEHAPREIPSEEATGITHDEDGDLFETVFDFDDVRIAKAFTDYCLMMIHILELQHTLSDLTWQRGLDHENMSAIAGTIPLALDICRSVDYHLKLSHGQVAAFYISLPCRLAYFALPRLSREAQWLVRVLDTVANSNGVEFARNVLHNVPIRKRKVVNGESRLLVSPATSGSETGTAV